MKLTEAKKRIMEVSLYDIQRILESKKISDNTKLKLITFIIDGVESIAR